MCGTISTSAPTELGFEAVEEPTELTATIFTMVRVPCGKEKGVVIRVERGTWHD